MITEHTYRLWQVRLNQSRAFRLFWQFWSNYSFVLFIFAFIVVYLDPEYFYSKNVILILSAISFFLARGVVVTIINLFIKRQRPYQLYNFSPITSKFFSFKTNIPNSFPSRHTTAYFSVAVIVFMYAQPLGIVLMVTSLAAGCARVVLGYHWITDILAGAIIGTIIGLLVTFLAAVSALRFG